MLKRVRTVRRVVEVFFAFIGILVFLTGCGVETEEIKPAPTEGQKIGKIMEIVTIYSVDPDLLTLIPVSVKKEKDISAEYIVSLLIANLHEYDIKTPLLTKKGKKMYISFSSGGAPAEKCNKKVERLILECFSNSILDNVDSVHDIVFQMDGKAYESRNFSFGKNEIYSSR